MKKPSNGLAGPPPRWRRWRLIALALGSVECSLVESDRKTLAAWHEKHFGIKLESWDRAVFRWSEDPLIRKAQPSGMMDPMPPLFWPEGGSIILDLIH